MRPRACPAWTELGVVILLAIVWTGGVEGAPWSSAGLWGAENPFWARKSVRIPGSKLSPGIGWISASADDAVTVRSETSTSTVVTSSEVIPADWAASSEATSWCLSHKVYVWCLVGLLHLIRIICDVLVP